MCHRCLHSPLRSPGPQDSPAADLSKLTAAARGRLDSVAATAEARAREDPLTARLTALSQGALGRLEAAVAKRKSAETAAKSGEDGVDGEDNDDGDDDDDEEMLTMDAFDAKADLQDKLTSTIPEHPVKNV